MTPDEKPEQDSGAEAATPSRLVRAVEAYFRHVDSGGDRDSLLREHGDLGDLLEPMFATEGAQADPTSRTVGDFRLVREIGRGGMGVVHEAVQVSLGRRVAVKLLPEHLRLQPASLARFKHEALTIARLDHPGIVKVLAVGEENGAPWFAMDLVQGTSMQALLAELRIERRLGAEHFRRVACLAAEVAEALSHAHGEGVVHRDVKPSNVLVTEAGHAVLTDFGLARDLELSGVSLGGGGTPHYMSPEQIEGRSLDARSDVFSLGVTLYEMLTLHRPFEGETREAVQREITLRDPIDPKRLVPDLPAPLAAIVLHALAKEPERRYGTAGEFGEDLRAFVSDRPVRARREGLFGRVRRWARREPAKAMLAATLALLIPTLAATMGYLFARWPELREGELRLIEQWLAEASMAAASSDRDQPRGLAAYRRVLERDPENVPAIVGLALTTERWESSKAALAFLDERKDLEARTPVLARTRGTVLAFAGGRAEADALMARLPPPVDGLDVFVAGVLRRRLAPEKSLAADRQFLTDLSLATRLSPTPNAGMYFALAFTSVQCGSARERDEIAETLARLWPESPNAWKVAGQTWEGIDDSKAEHAYRRAVELWPGYPSGRFELGRYLLQRGDAAAAATELRRLVDSGNEDKVVHETLVKALEQSGDLEGARLVRARR